MAGCGGEVVELECVGMWEERLGGMRGALWLIGHSGGKPSRLGLRVGLPGSLHVGEMKGAILVVV